MPIERTTKKEMGWMGAPEPAPALPPAGHLAVLPGSQEASTTPTRGLLSSELLAVLARQQGAHGVGAGSRAEAARSGRQGAPAPSPLPSAVAGQWLGHLILI